MIERDLFAGYGIGPAPQSARTTRAVATEQALLERIAELVAFRGWYRRQRDRLWWMDLAERNDVELRALVTVARRARRG